MVDEDDLLELEEAARPRRKGARRGLTVRMLAAKSEWLGGLLVWQEDRVWWKQGHQLLHPEPADLARTERALNRIRTFPRSANLLFGDADGWLERRCHHLELAKALAPLRCGDFPSLLGQARDRHPAALQSLCRLLLAEAHCVNDLPSAPSAALMSARRSSVPALQALAGNEGESLEGRALASLLLGALTSQPEPALGAGEPGLRRAWQWGAAEGLPTHPALVARLLRVPDGRGLAYRCDALLAQEGVVAGPENVRAWLANGVSEATAVELAEALGTTGGIWERLRNWRPLLPPAPAKKRHQLATWCQETAEELESKIRDALLRIADVTQSPRAVASALDTLSWLLPDTTPTVAWGEEALIPVRAAVKLPRDLATAWLDLLQRRRAEIWTDYEALRNNPEVSRDTAHLLVQQSWCSTGLPLFRFVERTGDLELAEEALSLDVAPCLGWMDGDTLDTQRATLAIARAVGANRYPHLFSSVHRIVRPFRDPAAARRELRPLVEALQRAPVDHRTSLFLSFTDSLHEPAGRARLKRTPAYFAQILAQMPEEFDWDLVDGIATVLVSLDQLMGESTAAIAETVIRRALDMYREKPDYGVWRMTGALEVACGLREPEELPDLEVVNLFLRHDIPSWKAGRDSGLKLLAGLPSFRRVLRRAFTAQPHRCMSLIEKLGLTGQLSVEAREPLRSLESEPPALPEGHPWGEVLRHAPDLELQVRSYVRNSSLLGYSDGIPAALARTLRRPQKLARELAYLESLAETGDSPALAARRASLRGQLDRLSRGEGQIALELREHFENIAGETVLAAAEALTSACYRRSLEHILGNRAEAVTLGEDWLNAALLASSIEQNRLLLRRMLRAEAEGRPDWRENHPVNARFLQQLAEKGASPVAWLSRRTRTVACSSVAGKRVRLHLEQQPLRILQMGNYFDTCLSVDGCNAFSTVANACELNKRVIYATDGRGRVVARKLIGLNEQGDLIGYNTYTNVDSSSARAELCRLVRAYAEDFAQACRLALSNEGTVPRLFAQAWYDDGRCDWSDDEAPPSSGQAHASRAAPMFARFSSRKRP